MPQTIAIVGAGFSGAMLTIQLLRQSPDARIFLIGDKGFGLGQAYSTKNPNHLLNVRAKNMSAFPDEPDHFVRWVQSQAGNDGGDLSGRFVGRMRYGVYVRQLLAQALWNARRNGSNRVRLIRGQVSTIGAEAPHTIVLRDGRRIVADKIVMATGNFPSASLAAVDKAARQSPVYRADPWAGNTTDGLDQDAPVLLIGTGLTMVDIVISLLNAGHRGRIHCLSRHGALPLVHANARLAPEKCDAESVGGLMVVMRALRRQAKQAVARGETWQQVLDGVRHHTDAFWLRFSQAERKRFLRHPRRFWDIHRHRMAPEIAAQLDAAKQTGQLDIRSGHLRHLTVVSGEAVARYQPRGGGEEITFRAARVFNCAGPASDFRKLADPLLRQLLDTHQVHPDPCRLGFEVSPDSALVAADGTVSKTLFAIGPMTKAAFWEIVAVPDIRLQAQTVAATLLE